jgi:hypothetical protein
LGEATKSESRFRDLFLEPTNNSAAAALAVYYHERSRKRQERIAHEWKSGATQQTGFAQEQSSRFSIPPMEPTAKRIPFACE